MSPVEKHLIEELAEYVYNEIGVDWHYEDDVIDMGDDGDGYVCQDITVVVLDDAPKIFKSDERQDYLEDMLVNLIQEEENE